MKISTSPIDTNIQGADDYAQKEKILEPVAGSKFPGCPESLIWKEYKNGSKEAFVYIYNKYFPVLYGYGHQLTSNSEIIEDCIQELFVDLSRKGKKLSDTNSIKFYLIKCLRNRYLRTVKNTNRIKENEQYFHGYEFHFSLSAEQKIIDAQLDDERIQKLNTALLSLNDRQREAIYYYFYQNLAIDEIAEIMDVTNRRSVQNLIYRAISFLRNNIDLGLFLILFPL